MIVDVHGHITPPELFELLPMPPSLADIQGMLDRKSELGIDMTVVGSAVGRGTMVPVEGLDNFAQPLDQLASFHDWLAETVREHAPRLAAYAYVNPFGSDAEFEQARTTVRDGPFVGLIVPTSVNGRYLDDPGVDGFFALAEELGVPIFLHPPAEPVGAASVGDFRLVEQVGRYLDVTMCLASLAFSGRLERHADLRWIAATAGGSIGLLAGRLDTAYAAQHHGGPPGGGPPPGKLLPKITRYPHRLAQPPSAYLANVYVDTANLDEHNQRANLALMGPGKLLFGTDSPPLATPLEACLAQVDRLGLDDDAKAGVLGQNAAELLGL